MNAAGLHTAIVSGSKRLVKSNGLELHCDALAWMDNATRRYVELLRTLVDEETAKGGERGANARAAARVGISAAYVSQLLSGKRVHIGLSAREKARKNLRLAPGYFESGSAADYGTTSAAAVEVREGESRYETDLDAEIHAWADKSGTEAARIFREDLSPTVRKLVQARVRDQRHRRGAEESLDAVVAAAITALTGTWVSARQLPSLNKPALPGEKVLPPRKKPRG